jgi:hypothetical protein
MKNLIEITNEVQILDWQIKKGDFIMVYDKNQWAKRKVLFVEKTFWGEDCYIVHFKYGSTTTTGKVFKSEIKIK